jgi:hypothetical protein
VLTPQDASTPRQIYVTEPLSIEISTQQPTYVGLHELTITLYSQRADLDIETQTQDISIYIYYEYGDEDFNIPELSDSYTYLINDPALKIYIPDFSPD